MIRKSWIRFMVKNLKIEEGQDFINDGGDLWYRLYGYSCVTFLISHK